MFAIVKSGSSQYQVSENTTIEVDKINAKEGDKITLEDVLLINDGKDVQIGAPTIKGAKVEAEVIKNFKDKKVIIFKKRRRQNSRRKNGFRAQKSELKILKIIAK